MHTITEVLNGGLVTSRHPALLNPGELQRADDCVYREKDPAIWRAPGRTALTSLSLGSGFRGLRHLSFDSSYTDQMLFLGRMTSGTPTWVAGDDILNPASHLYASPFTALSGLTPVEIGGQGRILGVVTSTSFDCALPVASCTITGTTTVTAPANSFTNVQTGMVVSGTGITAGTRVSLVTSDTVLILDTPATNATVTLTFIQYPFLATAVGASVIGTSIGTNIIVQSVSNQDGTTGHYRTAVLSSAPSGGNGTYTPVFTFGLVYNFGAAGTEILDAVQYNARKYFVWDGQKPLQAVEWQDRSSTTAGQLASILRARPVGLRAVTTAPTLALQTGQATGWNIAKGAGTYWFLITEIYSPNGDISAALKDPVQRLSIVESAYLGTDPSTTGDSGSQSGVGLPVSKAIVTPATDNILITFPAVVNNGADGFTATHWGIYIYGPTPDMPSLASLRRCAVVPMKQYTAGATYTLTDAVLTQTKYAGATRAVTGYANQFSHADHLTGPHDSEYGSTKTSGISYSVTTLGAQGLTTFGFSTSGAYNTKVPIGVELQVFCRSRFTFSGLCTFWAQLLITGGARKTSPVYRGVSTVPQTVIIGGPSDTLGVTWVTADPGSFEVEIGIQDGVDAVFDLYDVAIKVYYTTNNVDFNGPAYRVVTYRDQVGLSVSDPARLVPPVCSTGDFFQGCLVVNNKSQENQIRYSLPGDPEAWPKPYEVTFNTRKRDKVTFIRTLNSLLFVGMANGVKRVNYLPRETDTDLNSGLAHEDISTDHGIPGPFCGVKFDMPGKGLMIAYASSDGMFLSNGIWTMPMNLDLDWANTVKLSALPTAILKVYPKEKWLALYYCPAGATHNKNTRALYFCYQADKIKDEYNLPAIGPVTVSARGACEATFNGTSYLFTGHESNGLTYVEDSGLSIPSGYQVRLNDDSADGNGATLAATDVQILPFIRTRKFYSITLNRDGYGERLYLLFSAYGSNAITATGACTINSTTVTVSGVSGTIAKGQRVLGSAIDAGTIVLNVSGSTVTLSRAANATGSVALTFDTGTLGLTVRGSGQGEAVKGLRTDYISTLAGDLVSVLNSNFRRGFELQIEKVPLTFDSNGDTLTWADLSTNMRLHTITYVVSDQGLPDTNRNAV